MKVKVEIDCTPLEARQFIGLPDVVPMQTAVMDKLQQQMMSIIRLRDAKRRAMQIADERAKEVVDLRMRLAKSYAVDVSMISRLRRKFTDR